MSEPSDTAPSSPPAAAEVASPPTDAPSSAAAESPFALAQRLVAERLERPAILVKLRSSGLDEEQARVALNAVDGRTPSDLPDATLAPGVNPLAPGRFAFSDIGLSGNPAVVALYWMAFGAAVMLLVAGLLVLPDFGVGEATEATHFWGRFGLGLGGAAFAWGVLRLITSVRLRRRS